MLRYGDFCVDDRPTDYFTPAHARSVKSLAFSKFDEGGPEKPLINFAWPYCLNEKLTTSPIGSDILSCSSCIETDSLWTT